MFGRGLFRVRRRNGAHDVIVCVHTEVYLCVCEGFDILFSALQQASFQALALLLVSLMDVHVVESAPFRNLLLHRSLYTYIYIYIYVSRISGRRAVPPGTSYVAATAQVPNRDIAL